MKDEAKYPIAEIFTSPQGEGVWTGTMMTFVRLAGCTVGKPQHGKGRYEFLSVYTEQCTLYDGRTFPCDTDYRVKERLTVEEILAQVPYDIKHVCISGGEPFMHDLHPLITGLTRIHKQVHIETSGTIYKDYKSLYDPQPWITVSPKRGMLGEMIQQADEIKLLVDENFDPMNVPIVVLSHHTIYIQPINGENTVNADNLRLCMGWQKEFPNWRISLQLHKVLESFVGEHVR